MSDLPILTFGDFELSVRRRTLAQAGRRLRIGSRAMDILLLLADRAGELVTKDEIQARVWPDIFVDEASIRVHLSSLRKALGSQGADFIHTVAGRGYIFVPQVVRSADPEPVARAPESLPLPLRLERLIGRSAVVDSLASQVIARRFVTVVGPGGIGKTSVAIETAARLADRFADGVRFIDLATLEDPEAAPGVFALGLGVRGLADLAPEALAAPLAGKQVLIVLDNCERRAEAAAGLAEALLRATPGVCVLATSREALRAEGEWLHRLPPLATPPTAPPSPTAALKYSAVELFVDRADAACGGYRLTSEDCESVVEICRRLDGLPLAIELAATTITTLGVRGVAAGLDDRLSLLTYGRRTAQSRHQTLRAALDWSYDVLSPSERAVLESLSVIAGGFDLSLAGAVAAIDGHDTEEIRHLVGALATKSLVTVETDAAEVRYRLLESTRAYAAEKLEASGARDAAMRRYATATLAFVRAANQARHGGRFDPRAEYASRLEDGRAVLEWGFAGGGDVGIARALTAELSDLWLQMGLMRECVAWCQKALTSESSETEVAAADEMRIRHAFRVAYGFKHGNELRKRAVVVQTLEMAQRLGDHDYTMRDLWSLASLELNEGRLEKALSCARQLRDAAKGPDAEAERLVGDRLAGSALHLMGRHAEARSVLEPVRSAYGSRRLRASVVRFQFDQLVLTNGFLAWIDWSQGHTAGALDTIAETVREAEAIEHPGSLGFALDSAVTLHLLCENLLEATGLCQRLSELAASAGFDIFAKRSEILQAIIQIHSGDLVAGLPRLQSALAPSVWKAATYRTPFFLAELASAELAAGLSRKALATIEDAIAWFGGVDAFWCAAECFRVKADILRAQEGPDATRDADAMLARAAAVTETQGAVAWRDRGAMVSAALRAVSLN